MDLVIPKKKHPVYNYTVSRCFLDNEKIFNRGRTIQERNMYVNSNFFDSNTYLFIDKRYCVNITLPFGIKVLHKIIYVGKGIFNQTNLFESRACKHHNDLLSKVVLDEPNRYECIMFGDGMTENEACCLEALWIWWLNKKYYYTLSSNNNIGNLINKRREIKWEKRCNKILNLNNVWK